MPPVTTCVSPVSGDLVDGEPAHDAAVGAEDAGDIGEEDEGVGFAGAMAQAAAISSALML